MKVDDKILKTHDFFQNIIINIVVLLHIFLLYICIAPILEFISLCLRNQFFVYQYGKVFYAHKYLKNINIKKVFVLCILAKRRELTCPSFCSFYGTNV